jgi:hypothetical protein
MLNTEEPETDPGAGTHSHIAGVIRDKKPENVWKQGEKWLTQR